jgi:hypothetical protein
MEFARQLTIIDYFEFLRKIQVLILHEINQQVSCILIKHIIVDSRTTLWRLDEARQGTASTGSRTLYSSLQ